MVEELWVVLQPPASEPAMFSSMGELSGNNQLLVRTLAGSLSTGRTKLGYLGWYNTYVQIFILIPTCKVKLSYVQSLWFVR